jgi:hypothetical protein
MRARQTKTGLIAIFFVSLIMALPRAVLADGITLTLSPVSSANGTTVTVEGTIANNGSSTIFLNNENFTLGSGFFSNGDITDFFLNAPLFLDGDTDSGLIPLFTFDIAPGTPAGPYTGNFLDILGGPGSSDQNLLSSVEFTVTVATTSVPEPSCLDLLGGALLVGAVLVLWRWKMDSAHSS